MTADQKQMFGVMLLCVLALALFIVQEILRRKAPERTRLGCVLSLGGLALVSIACLSTLTLEKALPFLKIAFYAVVPALLVVFALFAILSVVAGRKFRGINRAIVEAQTRHEQGDTAGAIAILDKQFALEAERDGLYRWILLANVVHYSIEQRDWARAEVALAQALESAPEDATLLELKGRLLQELGQLDEARGVIESTLEIHPKSVAVHTRYAKILVAAGDFERATEVLALADEFLANEKQVDVADRSDWREKELIPIAEAIGRDVADRTSNTRKDAGELQ